MKNLIGFLHSNFHHRIMFGDTPDLHLHAIQVCRARLYLASIQLFVIQTLAHYS